MKRLCVQLDDVAFMRSALQSNSYDPVQFGILAENFGAHGLGCTFISDSKGVSERDVRILKETRKSFLNVKVPVHQEAVRVVLSAMPDMVTFVDAKLSEPGNIQPIDETVHLVSIEEMLPDLQANNISVAVFIQPEISILRTLSKYSVDYVELDASRYTGAEDINEEMLNLDKIKSAAIAAGKLGLGVNCSGGINYAHIAPLAQIPNMEDIIIGGHLIRNALFKGIEKAVDEAIQLIRYREYD